MKLLRIKKILADDDEEGDDGDDNDGNNNDDDDGDDDDEDDEIRTKSYDVRLNEDTVIRRLKEDTVIRKIVGSTVFDEPKFENACHHGLVDPTVNLKQAMDDINGMFGKPLNFVRTRKSKKEDKGFGRKPNVSNQAFFILADEDSEKDGKAQGEGDFFEPTIFTKEAMNEINDLFGKPLDF
ncbi:hypothetical protein KSP40_PGU022821 [Platanthera guangdongensis]|uniref:Uncharacterized protein n=1 Tax=Platanthera guangdongensis TaxID=2320717 RepID=A0ABR2LSH8_9ASPA